MSDHQPLNDDPLAAEIERALAVNPSPEFTARVRATVAELPAPGWGAWRLRWALATTASLAAVGVLAMVLLDTPRPGSTPIVSRPLPPSPAVVANPPAAERPDSGGNDEPRSDTMRAGSGAGESRADLARAVAVVGQWSVSVPESELLLPPAEIAAWRDYLDMFSEGDYERPLPRLVLERGDVLEPADIVIPPLALSADDPIQGEVE